MPLGGSQKSTSAKELACQFTNTLMIFVEGLYKMLLVVPELLYTKFSGANVFHVQLATRRIGTHKQLMPKIS